MTFVPLASAGRRCCPCVQSSDAAYLARHIALQSGARIDSTALTVNRLCGSGFQALVSGTQEIKLGEASVALVGGTESMSQAPMAAYGHKVRFGTALGQDLSVRVAAVALLLARSVPGRCCTRAHDGPMLSVPARRARCSWSTRCGRASRT